MAATATAITYLQQIDTARECIHECFIQAHEMLTAREATLLNELKNIQDNYEKECKNYEEELQGLEKSKQSLKYNLRNNDTLNEALFAINHQIAQIMKLSSEAHTSLYFLWTADLKTYIQQAGEIIISTIPQSISEPVMLDQSIVQFSSDSDLMCRVCNKTFTTRTKLAFHILMSGHGAYNLVSILDDISRRKI